MQVKICGITSVEAAKAAIEAGADMIGFVFAPSKRQISVQQAAEIAKSIPATVKKVGVFVNEPIETVLSIINEVVLDIVQLHGDETTDYIQEIPITTIKAFTGTETGLRQAANSPANYILIDSPPKSGYRGGNGKVFDWSLLRNQLFSDRLILAGGLHAENVGKAIRTVNPVAVDVSSGVETDGKKDPKKIQQFIRKAKQ